MVTKCSAWAIYQVKVCVHVYYITGNILHLLDRIVDEHFQFIRDLRKHLTQTMDATARKRAVPPQFLPGLTYRPGAPESSAHLILRVHMRHALV